MLLKTGLLWLVRSYTTYNSKDLHNLQLDFDFLPSTVEKVQGPKFSGSLFSLFWSVSCTIEFSYVTTY